MPPPFVWRFANLTVNHAIHAQRVTPLVPELLRTGAAGYRDVQLSQTAPPVEGRMERQKILDYFGKPDGIIPRRKDIQGKVGDRGDGHSFRCRQARGLRTARRLGIVPTHRFTEDRLAIYCDGHGEQPPHGVCRHVNFVRTAP